MCLDRITQKLKKYQEGTGYKIFIKDSDETLWGQFFGGCRPTGRWLKERDHRNNRSLPHLIDSNNNLYQLGWHIYFTRKDAVQNLRYYESLCEVIKRVKYRKAHTIGVQNWSRVIVAKEIFIVPGGKKS